MSLDMDSTTLPSLLSPSPESPGAEIVELSGSTGRAASAGSSRGSFFAPGSPPSPP